MCRRLLHKISAAVCWSLNWRTWLACRVCWEGFGRLTVEAKTLCEQCRLLDMASSVLILQGVYHYV